MDSIKTTITMEKSESKYEEYQVVRQLGLKSDLQIHGKRILELKPPHSKCDVGIKSRGKIDFLTKHCGYTHTMVDKF